MKISLLKLSLCLMAAFAMQIVLCVARPVCAGTEVLTPKSLIAHRLNARQLAALNAAKRVQVSLTVLPAKDTANLPETTLTSKMQSRAFLNAFRAALMDDHPYATVYEPRVRLPENVRSVNFTLFNAGQDMPALEVVFYPNSREVYAHTPDPPLKDCQPGYFIIDGLFSPRIMLLMKQAFPQAAQVQALHYGLKPASATSLQIPPDVLRRAAMVRPGMTRADLLRVFKEMGGLSTAHQRTYYMNGVSVPLRVSEEVTENGVKVHQPSTTERHVLIDAWFAPRHAPLRWINGVGVPLNPYAKEYMRPDEQPDDIIVYLSAPYAGGLVAD